MSIETRMSRRQLLREVAVLGGGLALAAPMLAACGPTPTPKVVKETVVVEKTVKETIVVEKPVVKEVTVAPPTKKEVVQLRMHVFTGIYGDFNRRRAKDFETVKPNMKVAVEDFPGAEYWVKVRALFAAKQLGDVVWNWISGGIAKELFHLGIQRPIDDFIKAEGFDLGPWYPNVVEGLRLDGKTIGLSPHANPCWCVLYYNEDILKSVGIPPEPPKTWERLVEYGIKAQVTEAGKVKHFGYQAHSSYYDFLAYMRCWGKELAYLSKDGKKCVIDSEPGIKEAVQFNWDMRFKHKFVPSPTQIEKSARDMWVAARVAMTYGSSNWAFHKEVEGKFKWFAKLQPPGPRGDKGAECNPHIASITAQSKNPADAWEWVKFICNQESGVIKGVMGAGNPGARRDSYLDPRVLEAIPEQRENAEAMEYAVVDTYAHNFRASEVIDAISAQFSNLWLEKIKPEEFLKAATKEVQDILNKPAP